MADGPHLSQRPDEAAGQARTLMIEDVLVAQVIRSDAFAGVERYVCDVSGALAERGWRVKVLGGAVSRMRAELPDSVVHHPAETTGAAIRALLDRPHPHIVHVHMTAAEFAAAVTKPVHRGIIV